MLQREALRDRRRAAGDDLLRQLDRGGEHPPEGQEDENGEHEERRGEGDPFEPGAPHQRSSFGASARVAAMAKPIRSTVATTDIAAASLRR